MKYSKYFLIIAFFGIVTSCSDFLDRTNPNEPDNVTFWVNEDQLKNALPPCYEALQKDYLVNWSESTAETVMWGNITSGLSKVSGGKHSYTDGFPFTTYWTGAYSYIYRCNNFLDNYNKAQVAQNKKDVYAAEVKTIRALMYFYLTVFWGDVPWVGEVIQPEDAYIERTPREKVIDQLVEDLKWAAERMPEERYTGDKLGRLDRWGALAILARIALQNERWELAAKTSEYIIENSPYGLYEYEKLFHHEGDVENDPKNIEAIVYSLFVPEIRTQSLPNETCSPTDYIRLNPTKSLVDAYLCTDGKPAKTGLEYYKKTGVQTSSLYKSPEEHYVDYFQNRDPRMKMTLYAPGDKWPGGDDGDPDTDKANEIFNLPRFASLQDNNRVGANSRTGFYLKKYNDIDLAGSSVGGHGNLNVIRFAEVLLIYAEATFELQGKKLTQTQIDYSINRLRDRVNMHRMNLDELSAWGMDLETELRRERRIELAGEGTRYADVMRWREGELRFGRAITGPSLKVCMNDLGANPYPDTGVDEFGDGTDCPGKERELGIPGRSDARKRVEGFVTKQEAGTEGGYEHLRENVSKQYAKREPRFYASVAFNGSVWSLLKNELNTDHIKDIDVQVFYYRGKNDGFVSTGAWLRTGIGIKKFVHPDDTNYGANILTKAEPAIRYAEILLIYAEAVNELSDTYNIPSWDGSTTYTIIRNEGELKKGIRPIRCRAGVPDYDSETVYQNKNEFRKKLKRERQIELMGEGQRYFDLRRWKDADVEESIKVYGCNGLMTEAQKESFHTPVVIDDLPTAFSRKLYFWPIAHEELKRNKLLTQNPGWTYND